MSQSHPLGATSIPNKLLARRRGGMSVIYELICVPGCHAGEFAKHIAELCATACQLLLALIFAEVFFQLIAFLICCSLVF